MLGGGGERGQSGSQKQVCAHVYIAAEAYGICHLIGRVFQGTSAFRAETKEREHDSVSLMLSKVRTGGGEGGGETRIV
jgi:hypothetical protein